MRPVGLVVCVIALVAACHRKALPEPAATSKHCATSVSASGSIEAAQTPAPIASSIIPVVLSVDVAMAKKIVESKVPLRVAASSGQSIGSLGTLSYTVDRGPFALGVDAAGNVLATTELSIRASVCKDVYALGCVQYASCSPTARVTASIPAKLTSKYAFAGSSVHLDVTKRCLVTAADIDATSYVEAAAAKELPKIKSKIDGSLPSLKADVERAWGAAQTTVPFAGACLALRPTSIVEGPAKLDHGKILLRLAIAATPTVDLPCQGDAPKTPLPPLVFDAKLSDSIELHVPVRIATSWLDEALKKNVAKAPVSIGGNTVTAIESAPSRDAVVFDTTIDGEMCGVARFVGAPKWNADARTISFEPLKPLENTLDPSPLAPVVAITPTVDDAKLISSLSMLTPMASEPGREIALTFDSHELEGLYVTPTGVEARFLMKGHANVDISTPP